MREMSRRKLLGKGAQAVAGGIVVSQIPALEAGAASKPSKSEAAVDYYQKLGVTPFINAAGTYTVLSASPCQSKSRQPSHSRPDSRST